MNFDDFFEKALDVLLLIFLTCAVSGFVGLTYGLLKGVL